MELRHLRYFVAVAEEANFTRAAVRLGIGQPPLSQQIKDLERGVGVVLFRRVPHGAELTEAGEAFLQEARRVLAGADAASLAAQRAARGETGRLRLGFTGSAHFNAVVPLAIRRFAGLYPDVLLQLDEAPTGDLLRRMEADDLDAAFTHSVWGPALHQLAVAAEPLLAALPVAHRCAGQASVALSGLANEPIFHWRAPSYASPSLWPGAATNAQSRSRISSRWRRPVSTRTPSCEELISIRAGDRSPSA